MTLFAELQRRKVFKVGAAYLVVAWLLIQVVATLAPQLQLPDWAPRLVTLLLMVGFPVALLLAWMLDVTPEGVKSETSAAGNGRMYAIAAALASVTIWFRDDLVWCGVGISSVLIIGAFVLNIIKRRNGKGEK